MRLSIARWGLLAAMVTVGPGTLAVTDENDVGCQPPGGLLVVPFVENHGQLPKHVAFSAKLARGHLAVTKAGEIVLALPGASGDVDHPVLITERLVQARMSVPVPAQPAPTRVSLYRGHDPMGWHSGLPSYCVLTLPAVYPGIDLELRLRRGTVEKLFHLRPGADSSAIDVAVEAEGRLDPRPDGALGLRTSLGTLRLSAPVAFQEINGSRHPVDVAYRLTHSGYGFELGDYDPAYPLTIDPLLAVTYLGGGASDTAEALLVYPTLDGSDTAGDVYVAGTTASFDFPFAEDQAPPGVGTTRDAYVARFDPDLSELEAVAFLVGDGIDSAQGLAVRPQSGDIYVAGTTSARDLPGVGDLAAQTSHGGGTTDAFVARLGPDLATPVEATYFGGSGDETGVKLGISVHGRIYIAGTTDSPDMPVGQGVALPEPAGQTDAFVAVFNTPLRHLVDATYVGGSGAEETVGIAMGEASETIWVIGNSTSAAMIGTRDDPGPEGDPDMGDGFVARVYRPNTPGIPAPHPFDYVTEFVGGSGADVLTGATGSGDRVYYSGYSTSTDFVVGGEFPDEVELAIGPGETGLFVESLSVGQYGFLMSSGPTDDFDPAGLERTAMACCPPVIAVPSSSPGLPETSFGFQTSPKGGVDAVIAAISIGRELEVDRATYFGGSRDDWPVAIAIDPATEDILIAGTTASERLPGTSMFWPLGGAQRALAGETDAFVARFDTTLGPALEWRFWTPVILAAAIALVLIGRLAKRTSQRR